MECLQTRRGALPKCHNQAKELEDPWDARSSCPIILSVLFGSLFAPGGRAENDARASSATSPVGRWKTIDDVTGKAKSVVAIWEENGKLYGRVQKLLDPDPADPNPNCDGCEGEQKGNR